VYTQGRPTSDAQISYIRVCSSNLLVRSLALWPTAPGTTDALQPKSAFSRFAPVDGADLKGHQRVDLTRSQRGPFTAALCAKQPPADRVLTVQRPLHAVVSRRRDEHGVGCGGRRTHGENGDLHGIPPPIDVLSDIAGKPYIYDPYAVAQQMAASRVTKALIDERSRGIHFEPVAAKALW
jgi:hypothetical protein